MKLLAFLSLFALVFVGVAAYSLQQKGLLTRETLDKYLSAQSEEREKPMVAVEPLELAVSVQESKEKLEEQSRDMDLKGERLAAQQKELDAQRALLEQKMEELKVEGKKQAAAREAASVPESGAELVPITGEMLQLVKMYESMPPDDAAAVLDKMPDQTVAQVLLQLRSRNAAQIMGELDEEKAAAVSKLLSVEGGTKKLPKAEPIAVP